MRRYRSVREYSPWNEPNLAMHPQNSDPRRIADVLPLAAHGCARAARVLGADVVDNSRLGTLDERLPARSSRPAAAPRLWGLHNYVDVNSTSRWGTRDDAAPRARRRSGSPRRARSSPRQKPTKTGSTADRRLLIRTGAARAVAATKRVFELAAMSPRITRVYIYHWRAGRHDELGLRARPSEAGTLRPSFDVFARQARLAAGLPAEPPEPVEQG